MNECPKKRDLDGIYFLVEPDVCEVTTVSAYDLLSEEDRKAITWVREHGGLDMAASRFESGEIAADMLWGKGHGRFWTTDEFEEEISKRLMPAGCEWPRFEDGEPVCIGDEISWRDEGGVVNSIELQDGGYYVLHAADGAEDWIHPQYFPGERVKRPTVLAADGEPLEVGQTVWNVNNGMEFTVSRLPKPGEYQSVKLRLDDGAFTGLDPDRLTHAKPEGWVRTKGAQTAPVGWYWANNGKSLFGGERKSALIKEDA